MHRHISLALLLLAATTASATNFFGADPHTMLLLRFESGGTLGVNAAHSADGTVTDVDLNTALEREGSGCADWDDGFTGDITIAHANQPTDLFDASDFSICGWFRINTVAGKTLINQGTEGEDLSVKLEVHDGGATESFQLSLGYGDGSSTDSYTHDGDLSASDWYWMGLAVDVDGNVRMRVYKVGTGKLGTDIDTACLHAYAENGESLVIGDYYDGLMDELVIFDRAISFDEMDAIYAGTFKAGDGPFTYYCSPDGDNDRIGTATLPWGPLSGLEGESIMGVYVNEGDTVCLQSGDHGYLGWNNAPTAEKEFTDWVYIKSEADADPSPSLTGMWLNGATYIKFDGSDAADGYIHVTPSALTAHVPDDPWPLIFNSNYSGCNHLWFNALKVYPTLDSSSWTGEDWAWYAYSGVQMGFATDISVTNCYFLNCCEGVGHTKSGATITGNTIHRWTENGIFISSGANITIADNTITDCMYFSHSADIWEDTGQCWHADSIQIGADGISTNLQVYGNYCNGAVDSTRDLKGSPQGLFLVCSIDGALAYDNIVMVYHGQNACTFGYGYPYYSSIKNLLIAHNTILETDGWYGARGYIRFQGTASDVRENIRIIGNTTSDPWDESEGSVWTVQDNFDTTTLNYDNEFVDFANGDVHLKSTSTLINQVTYEDADLPTTDRDSEDRDATPDAGAYEYVGESPEEAPAKAYSPSPADDATGVALAPTLSWTTDGYTDDMNVYFGTISGALSLIGNQETLTYAPTGLNYSIEYFWRVDANNAYGLTTGDEWSFTVMDEPATPTTNNFTADPNCVALWRLEDGALTVDSIGTNTLTLYGVVSSEVPHQEGGYAGLWDRSDGPDYLQIADADLDTRFPLKSDESQKKISICCWVYFDTSPTGYLEYVMAKWSTAQKCIGIFAYDADGLRLGIGDGSTGEEHFALGSEVQVGRWYHIGATYDDSDKSYRLRVWDDTAGSASEQTGTATDNIGLCDDPFTIGSSTSQTYSLDGRMDEVVVFNDILSAAEIDKIRQGIYKTSSAVGTRPHRHILMIFD